MDIVKIIFLNLVYVFLGVLFLIGMLLLGASYILMAPTIFFDKIIDSFAYVPKYGGFFVRLRK